MSPASSDRLPFPGQRRGAIPSVRLKTIRAERDRINREIQGIGKVTITLIGSTFGLLARFREKVTIPDLQSSVPLKIGRLPLTPVGRPPMIE